MNKTLIIMNYFILISAAFVTYGGVESEESILDAYWPLATAITIYLEKKSNARFWTNIAYLGTAFYIFAHVSAWFHLEELTALYSLIWFFISSLE